VGFPTPPPQNLRTPSDGDLSPAEEEDVLTVLQPAQQADELGRLAGYRILKVLGQGGMGVVFHGEDPQLQRPVALKAMRPALVAVPSAKKRFLREARAAAAIKHDNIVSIYQVGEDRGFPFLAMEFLEGEALDQRLKREPKPPLAEVLRIGREMAEGLAAAHERGLVHRDVKPGNIWLEGQRGRVKILDFGLARSTDDPAHLTQSGAIVGTPSYMAPEQAEGRTNDIGPATDVWALGVVLYQMLAGRLPFRGGSTTATLHEICTRSLEPLGGLRPDVSPALEAIVFRSLQKEAARRYPSARALAENLQRFLDVEVAAETKIVPPMKRKMPLVWGAALVAVVLLVAAGWGLRSLLWNGSTPHTTETEPVPPSVAVPFKGSIDVIVTEPKNPRRDRLRLHEPGARPLKPGDEVKVEVVLNRPGFVYILWIDAKGKPIPIYPWREGEWDARPSDEKPVMKLISPEGVDIYPIDPGPQGLETLVLLVRETKLERDVDLRKEIGEVGAQDWPDLTYVAWFENGVEVMDEPNRAPSGKVGESSNPAVRTQKRLQQRLGERFEYTRAVSFGNLGK
jgi:serine/threonine protein kinase